MLENLLSLVRRPSSAVRRLSSAHGASLLRGDCVIFVRAGGAAQPRGAVARWNGESGWRRRLSLLENLFDQALAKLEPEERARLMESLATKAIETLSPVERKELLDHVVDRFLDGLTQE